MESLAIAAACVTLSVIGAGTLAWAAALTGSLWCAPLGVLSIIAGGWWWTTLPNGIPILGIFAILGGIAALYRAVR